VRRKKKLGDESLNWIKDTKGSSPMTSVSKKETKGESKSKRLGVLKQYVSEEAEVKKIKSEKAPPPIPDDSPTIVKRKKGITHKKKEIKEKITVSEKEEIKEDIKEEVKEKEAVTPEKEEIKKIEALEKKEVTDTTSMAVRSKKILLYPISRLKKTANGISDNFLSGIWLTGVTIGLVKRSADKIKKSIIGS